jgi:hypothetical protein
MTKMGEIVKLYEEYSTESFLWWVVSPEFGRAWFVVAADHDAAVYTLEETSEGYEAWRQEHYPETDPPPMGRAWLVAPVPLHLEDFISYVAETDTVLACNGELLPHSDEYCDGLDHLTDERVVAFKEGSMVSDALGAVRTHFIENVWTEPGETVWAREDAQTMLLDSAKSYVQQHAEAAWFYTPPAFWDPATLTREEAIDIKNLLFAASEYGTEVIHEEAVEHGGQPGFRGHHHQQQALVKMLCEHLRPIPLDDDKEDDDD